MAGDGGVAAALLPEGWEPDDHDDPRGRSRGKRATTGSSDRHGDPNAISKAQKDIDKLKEALKEAKSKAERRKIEQKIPNITETAQRRAEGETHWK